MSICLVGIAQGDTCLDTYEEYLGIVKTDQELYGLHKSSLKYMDKAQGFGIASGFFLGLSAFGAFNIYRSGNADPEPGALILANAGGILGALTGLIAAGSYIKGKKKKKKIKKLLYDRYDLIDNYTITIRSNTSGLGLVLSF